MEELLRDLIQALTLQSQAINSLAQSNMAIVDSLSQEQDDDPEPRFDMAGRPI